MASRQAGAHRRSPTVCGRWRGGNRRAPPSSHRAGAGRRCGGSCAGRAPTGRCARSTSRRTTANGSRGLQRKGDRDSVGLFQQRDHYGSQEDRLDPTWATNAFFDELERVHPDGSADGFDLARPPEAWKSEKVLYLGYVREFYDSDGDGEGDVLGMIDKMAHLSDLGVNAMWLMPLSPREIRS